MTTAKEQDILTPNEVEDLLTELDGWVYENERLVRRFTASSFMDGMELLNQVAAAAEEMNHHPDMFISFKKIRFQLWTHKLNAITKLDAELARKISGLALEQGIS